MTLKTRLTMWCAMVSLGIGLATVLAARIDRRVDLAVQESAREVAQEARLKRNEDQIVLISEYMAWSTRLLIRIAGEVGAKIDEAPPAPVYGPVARRPARGPTGR